jgi:hypothetical protein
MRWKWLLPILIAACADSADQTETDCMVNERLVRDVCTQLGPDDGCVESADTCIALCDGLTACDHPGGLRPLSGWPTAPDGYCIECTMP